MKIFIGYDPRDHDAFRVCEHTIRENARAHVDVIALKDWELRQQGVYWRPYTVDERGQMWDAKDRKPFSTQFSFTRFAVPLIMDYADEWVLFCDADMLFKTDVTNLLDEVEGDKALYCVQHDHQPQERTKMDGVLQTVYHRKNWSSLMLMNPARCRGMTQFMLNNATGSQLHALTWVDEAQIGALDPRWNHLAGYDDPTGFPYVIHYTLGTPDMALAPKTEFDAEWWDALDRADKGIRDAAA